MTNVARRLTLALIVVSGLVLLSCGNRETAASTSPSQSASADPYENAQPLALLESISPAIPVYPGIEYSPDLTRQDNLNAERMYGRDSQIWTFATNQSFPKVWHYYVTWLGMFRSSIAPPAYPPTSQTSRSIQINLNEAMQNAFIPGDEIEPDADRVILEIAETDTRARTIVRYVISPNVGPMAAQAPPAPAQ